MRPTHPTTPAPTTNARTLRGQAAAPRRLTLLASLTIALCLVPALVPPVPAAPTPLSADLPVWNEDFEGAFPGANWVVNDTNLGNGTDYWGPSAQRKLQGNGSAWSGSVGSQTLFWNATGNATNDPYSNSFENATQNGFWNVSDDEPLEGPDYWGQSAFRAHNGTYSMWCAQIGFNNYTSDFNNNSHVYDNMMTSYLWRTVNFSRVAAINATAVDLSFWYFTATENGVDFLDVVYDNGGGWTVGTSFTGDSAGWQQATTTLPTDTLRFGFRFISDVGGVLEGAYIDDLTLSATHNEPNQGLHIYDIQMNATMSRIVDLSRYATAYMNYSYWLDASSPNDTLSAMYLVGTNWTYLDTRTGNSGGAWNTSQVSIPVNATRVGFRFFSGIVGHREGAYIDNVRVVGHVNSILCNATVFPTTGYESNTVFSYSVSATQGLAPYGWSWNFNGSTNNTQVANRTFGSVGNYTGSITVSDAAGQICTTSPPLVTVVHDTTIVHVSPTFGSVVEGSNVTVLGQDRWFHPLVLNWTLSPSACGSLSAVSGLNVTLRANVSAGGLLCVIRGSYAPGINATANITVYHDFSTVNLVPPSATVIEGGTLNMSASDANGHGLNFVWSASCGSFTAYNGANTTFQAGNNGGSVCHVSAVFNGTIASADITVLQDTSVIKLSPDFALVVEGQSLTLGALNRFDHIIDVNWSVAPPECGAMSVGHGNASVFQSSVNAGGLSCTITGTVGPVSGQALVNVSHDVSVLTLTAEKSALLELERMQLTFLDVHGHPYSAAWRVDPQPCGTLSPLSGGIVNFTAGPEAAGLSCVITASVNAQAWRVNVTVAHGPPASVNVDPPAAAVVEGTGVTLGAAVRDQSGHILRNFTIDWTSSCAQLTPSEGPSTVATPGNTDGGKTCLVNARFANFSATITLQVSYATPYTVTVTPSSASLSAGQSQEFTATVTDAHGVVPNNATVKWTSTCGGLSASVGPKVTVTAPSDLGGGSCRVSASVAVGGTTSTSEGSLTTGMSLIIPILIAIPIAVGVFLFLRWRKNRPPPFEKIGEGLDDPKKFEVEIR